MVPVALTLVLLCLQVSSVSARSMSVQGTPTHNWCANTAHKTYNNKRLAVLQESVEKLTALKKVIDWELVLEGLDTVFRLTMDAWRFVDNVLDQLVGTFLISER